MMIDISTHVFKAFHGVTIVSGDQAKKGQRYFQPLTNGEYTTPLDQYHHPHQHHRGRRYTNRVAGVQMLAFSFFSFWWQFFKSACGSMLKKKTWCVGNEKGVVGRMQDLGSSLFRGLEDGACLFNLGSGNIWWMPLD